ncbi:hypothetical protein [Lacrimispora xylanisolvens]|uniref:hypothetical protein n=1 Tax=Lacrimispora xylanisolvens TaxID=384636 RepID=UPI002402B2D6
MENGVKLDFKKDITNLAGYEFGQLIYMNQVKGRINLNNEFEIIFPDHVTAIASSFVQGFFSEIVGVLGLLETERNAKIKASTEDLANSVLEKLE